MDYKNLLEHLRIPKVFIHEFGINTAILLYALIDKEHFLIKQGILDEGHLFFYENDYIEIDTALSINKIKTARKKLIEANIIEYQIVGNKSSNGKAKSSYIINTKEIQNIFEKYVKNKELSFIRFFDFLLKDEGYIQYPINFAHTIGINETLLIKSLLSLKDVFEKDNTLANGYFYRSVSKLQEDTGLTKKQQYNSIAKLIDLNLVIVNYGDDSTRYFALNEEKIENLELLKVKKEKIEKLKVSRKKELPIFENPFNKGNSNTDSGKGTSMNQEKELVSILKKNPSTNGKGTASILKKELVNNEKVIAPKLKSDTIKNKYNTKEEKQKEEQQERIKLLLLNNGIINKKTINRIIDSYTPSRINEVILECNKKDRDNPGGFIISALDTNYVIKKSKLDVEKKYIKKRKIDLEIEEKKILENIKTNRNKELVEKWINENIDEYDSLYKKEENIVKEKYTNTKLNLKNPSILIKSNVKGFIKTDILKL